MLRKLITALLILLALAGLAVGAGLYLLNNESFLKKQVHKYVLEATGRSLEIDGALTLDLGSETTLEAHGIRFSNAAWADRADLAKIGRLFIAIDLGSLFEDKPILRNIEIDDCRVDLVENDQGEANWDVMPAADETEQPEETETGLQEPTFQLDHVRIGNCEITLFSPERDRPLESEITTLELRLQESGNYQKHATGIIDGIPLTFEGNIGPVRALWQGGRFDHDIELLAGKIKLVSSGTVTDVKTLTGANIAMNFSGPEIGVIIEDFALPPFSTGDFDFSLDFNTEGTMTQLDISGDLGSLEANAHGQLDRLIHPTVGELVMTVSGPNLGALAETLGVDNLVTDPFTLTLESSVKDGRVQLNPLAISTQDDRLDVTGTIGPRPDFLHTELDIALHSDDTDRWMTLMEAIPGPIGVVDARVKLTTDQTGITAIEAALDQAHGHLETTGSMGRFPALDQPDFAFDFKTPNLQKIGTIFKAGGLPAVPATINGRVRQDGAGLHFDNVQADLVRDQFRVSGLLTKADNLEGSSFNVEADITSTARFGEWFDLSDLPDQSLNIRSVLRPVGKGLAFKVTDGQLGDMKLKIDGQIADLASPALIDSDFDISLPSLALMNFLLPETKLPDLPFSASGHIRNLGDKVRLQEGQLTLGQTTAQVDALIHPGDNLAGSTVTLSGSGSDLRELVSIPQLESLPHDFKLSGSWTRSTQGDELENIDISLGDMNLRLSGHTGVLPDTGEFSIQAQLEIPDVSVLNPLVEQTLHPESLSLNTTLEGTRGLFEIKDFTAKLGNSDLAGDIHVDRREKLKLSGAIESEYLDLRPYQKEEQEAIDAVEQAADGTSPSQPETSSSEKLFDDTPVKSMQESPLDLQLDIKVEKAGYGNTEVRDITLGVLWQDYVFQLSPFEASGLAGSDLAGSLSIDARGSKPELKFKLHGKDISLGLIAAEGQDPSTYPPVELNIDLNGSGTTRHELATSLDGTVRIFWGSGLYAATGLGLIFSDFITELMTALNPFSKTSEYSKLECGVVGADVESGMVTVQPILIQDEKITIVSEGTIDLETEKLDLVFNTKPRKGFGLSAGVVINSLIKVGGTLASPGIQIDAGSAVVSGGTAIATVGISLLAKSFADRFLSSKDPCGDARKKLAEHDASP